MRKTLMVGGWLMLAVVVAVLLGLIGQRMEARKPRGTPLPPPPSGQPPTKRVPAGSLGSDNQRRLFRENRRADDSARHFIVQRMLREGGERCDEVERMVAGAPGAWTVTCAPGYTYAFTFDANGALQSARRLR